jgi:hypothetical protein
LSSPRTDQVHRVIGKYRVPGDRYEKHSPNKNSHSAAQGDRIWRFVRLRAGRIECKASKSDTEFHGARNGVPRSRSFWRFAQNYWDRVTVFGAKRNNAYSVELRDTPCRACSPCC